MSIDTTEPSPNPGDPAPPRGRGRRRLHPLAVGCIAAVASVLAGTASALVYVTLVEDEPTGREPEFELVLRPEDAEGATHGHDHEAMDDRLPGGTFAGLDGPDRSFDDYRGTPLVVNLWASTCAPCVDEMPDLERVHQENQGEVAFLGIAVKDTEDGARSLVDRTGVTYDIAQDPGGALAADLQLPVLPGTIFVDADGKVVDMAVGALSLEEMRTRVAALRT